MVPHLKYQFRAGIMDVRLLVKDQRDPAEAKYWKEVDIRQFDPFNNLPPFIFETPENTQGTDPTKREVVALADTDNEDDKQEVSKKPDDEDFIPGGKCK